MLWIRVRKGDIDAELREILEQYRIGTLQALLAANNYFRHKGHLGAFRSFLIQ